MSQSTLVILPNNLGDVIMATPVLEGLRAAHPDASVSFLVEEGFESGIENSPHIDRVVRFPRKAIRSALRSDSWSGGVDMLRDFRRDIDSAGYTRIVNLCQHEFVAYLVSLLVCPDIVGRRFLREGNQAVPDTWSQYLYAIPFARRFNSLHATDVYRRIARVSQHRGGYTVRLSEQEMIAARGVLAARGIPADAARIAVFQPGAAYPAKRWAVKQFAALGRMLLDAGWHIAVSGAPSERDIAQGISDALAGRCCVTAGETTFRQSMAIVSHAQACVTGDTALMHAAAAFDVPTYALFGPTNPVETGPYGTGHWVFAGKCQSRPCFCVECRSMLCMKSISARTVFSCMERGDAGADPGCDVYRTRLDVDGDCGLMPVSQGAFEYFDAAGAEMTRMTVSSDERSGKSLTTEPDRTHVGHTREFLRVLAAMTGHLDEFLRMHDVKHVTAFEQAKGQLAGIEGIGTFWSALLNLRLNSVPVLDPVTGVRWTVEECRRTYGDIARCLRGQHAGA